MVLDNLHSGLDPLRGRAVNLATRGGSVVGTEGGLLPLRLAVTGKTERAGGGEKFMEN